MGRPYWLDEIPAHRPSRRLARTPDVEIVGGGVTGCACALALARGGAAVRVHEAREIASGASGRNGGFALRGGAMSYAEAREVFGRERAAALWHLTERALERLGELAGDAFERTGSLRLAADELERRGLRSEYEALREDGFEVEWVDDLPPSLARRFDGALRHPRDGSVHPARWVRRLASYAASEGVELREQSRVGDVAELAAPTIVIATDGYTGGLIPELDAAVRATRGQVVVTEPLHERLFSCPHYARHGYDYWQQLRDRRLVVGGWRDASLDTEYTAEEATTPLIQARIEAFITELVGELPRISHRWAGIFGTTEDRLPVAGRMPGRDGIWAALGYSGHGNVLGLACGELVAHAILGRPTPELALFDPARLA